MNYLRRLGKRDKGGNRDKLDREKRYRHKRDRDKVDRDKRYRRD